MAKTAIKSVKKSGSSASKSKSVKRVYFFGANKAEGRADQKLLLGGKGANLHDMTSAGLPVPPGFSITTESCADYNKLGGKLPAGLMDEVRKHLARLETVTGKKFGDPANPLLVSVRSGAAVSMPGMMDTVLNLGLTDAVTDGLAKLASNERFAYDSYRRLINMFGDVVMGIDHEHFEHELSAVKQPRASPTTPTSAPATSAKSSAVTRKSTRSTWALSGRRSRSSSSNRPSWPSSRAGTPTAPSAIARSTTSAAWPAPA